VTAVDKPPTAAAWPSTQTGITIWYMPIWLAGMIRDIYMRNINPMIRHNMPDTAKITVPFTMDFADIFSPCGVVFNIVFRKYEMYVVK
jgi:hypothetical protein